MAENDSFKRTENSPGITDVPGFRAASAACDIRKKGDDTRLDLGMIFSPDPCTVAAVFTTNDVVAPPVTVCRELLKNSRNRKYHGLIVNSGNANACTGEQGLKDARAMIKWAAEATEQGPDTFFVASTGRIGEALPMDRIEKGIGLMVSKLGRDSAFGKGFNESILTSDTRTKSITIRIEHGDRVFTVAGCAKGAGMIEPNMATMLAFLATDLEVDQPTLQGILNRASNRSFNRISIDGDMSTNDSVFLFANGASQVSPAQNADLLAAFSEAVSQICHFLAEAVVSDGEKISHVIDLVVEKAASEEQAEAISRAVSRSFLVKASWFGEDPNWGRLVDAAGYAKVGYDFSKASLYYDDIPVIDKGKVLAKNRTRWKEVVSRKRFTIRFELNQGASHFRLLTTDLTADYLHFNKSE